MTDQARTVGVNPSAADSVGEGSWVEVERILLPAGRRLETVPEDTAAVPLVLRVRGFLIEPHGKLGSQVHVRTLANRRLSGTLVDVAPSHDHTFGPNDASIANVGWRARALLDQRR